MVDALVSTVAENLIKMATDEAMLLWGHKEKLQHLSTELTTIRSVLQAAEMQQIKDKTVKIWLQNLKYVAYDIDDMVEEWDQVRNNFSSPLSYLIHPIRHYKFGHKIDAIKKELAEISARKDRYHFAKNAVQEEKERQRELEERQTFNFVEPSSIIGRDGDIETLKELIEEDLIRRNGEVPTISVVGMGGLGKTALAQVIFNNEKNTDRFEKCIWVCVSNVFNAKDIMINIVKNSGGRIERNDDTIERIGQEVLKVIENKRYLIVLDDVWNEDVDLWEPLLTMLKFGATGSRILVTARNRGVADAIKIIMKSVYIHELKPLSKDDCWSIFEKNLFESDDDKKYMDLEDVGKKIVEKCSGIPLAIKTIARAIQKMARGKTPTREQLENILNSDLWDQSLYPDSRILPALMLSYSELSPALKNCFCYCSLFEKDFVYEKDLLTKLWVAQGYVVANDEQMGVDIEYRAEGYFNELFDRSLFQEPIVDKHGVLTECKMHDLVHDLAEWVTKVEFCRLEEKHPTNKLSLGNARHCVITGNLKWKRDIELSNKLSLGNARHCVITGNLKWKRDIELSGSENLRTLFHDGAYFTRIDVPLKKLRSIRVLSVGSGVFTRKVYGLGRLIHLRYLNLDWTGVEHLPNAIGNLIHLRHLNLKGARVRKLPNAIGKLKQLQCLDLQKSEIRKLPKTLTSLSHLRTLNLSLCTNLMYLPDGILGLGSLRHLDVNGCRRLKMASDAMERLALLQTLGMFPITVGGNGCINIGELGGLNRLHGQLAILNLEAVSSRDEACSAKLPEKTSLTSLSLSWSDSFELGVKDYIGVLEGLRPPFQLLELRIVRYPGGAFPSWVGDAPSLLHLGRLELVNCNNCTQLPSLGRLPCLKILIIEGHSEVEIIGEEFFFGVGDDGDESRTSIIPFPQLEYLQIRDMKRWDEWKAPQVVAVGKKLFVDGSVVASESQTIMPRLRSLHLMNCPKLEKLSFLPPSIRNLHLWSVPTYKLLAICHTLSALEELYIAGDEELTELPPALLRLTNLKILKIGWGGKLSSLPEELTLLTNLQELSIRDCASDLLESCKMGGRFWPRISHIPHILIDGKNPVLAQGRREVTRPLRHLLQVANIPACCQNATRS